MLPRRRTKSLTLEDVALSREATVAEIDGGRRVRSHLNTLGIHVGDIIRVVERAPFRGPVLVEIHGTRVALGRGIARKVKVDTDALRPGRPA
ncbi:MAG: ferrous iron transport protein A [Acidobacteria bacterium]|nr:ferrous iron transport protein A [Acidobacteriota bacterium]